MDPAGMARIEAGGTLPAVVGFPAAAVLLALWIRSHAWTASLPRRWRTPALLFRSGLGFLCLWTAAEAARQAVVLATNWRTWPVLLAAALLVEGSLALYRLERRVVARRTGVALAALRAALILLAAAMLLQPVIVLRHPRLTHRRVPVLFDASASMRVPDNNLKPFEKVRLAAAMPGSTLRRPFEFEKSAGEMTRTAGALQAQLDWLNALASAETRQRQKHFAAHGRAFRSALADARSSLETCTNALLRAARAPFLSASPARTNLADLAAQFQARAASPLADSAAAAAEFRRAETNRAAFWDSMLQGVRRAAAGLAELQPGLETASERVDESFYASLDPAARAGCDRLSELTRAEIARRLLGGPPRDAGRDPAADAGLLLRLDREYGVDATMFAAAPREEKPAALLDPAVGTNDLGRPPPPDRLKSDLVAALERAASGLDPGETAGIVLLSDGRHNAAAALEPLARSLGAAQVPVYPVVFGATRKPPTDAAIASFDAPEMVTTNDRVTVRLELKLDGMAGSNATVRLFDGDRLVASNVVAAAQDAFRARVQLSDSPKTNGLHLYRVAVQALPGEVSTNNNGCAVPVWVNSDRVRLLLIDGYPRWEFRYLKNLFVSRDSGVTLQYVLFHPDQIAGMTNRPARPASAVATDGQAEATALPETEPEWMKFDAIILGDVSPSELGPRNMEALRKFVVTRGGTVVVIAGMRHMPHAFSGTPLAALLPVLAEPAQRALPRGPEDSYRIGLTDEGRDCVFLKLADDPAENAAAWGQVPEIYWRHAIQTAKEGASVLAFAMPAGIEQQARGAGRVPDEAALSGQRRRERERALVASQHDGLGNVLFFAFDHTWRLRYRKGDQYHHKLWGQVLRWATADRIAFGADSVRVGTDRPRYGTDTPVRLRARLAAADMTPVVDAEPEATVRRGDRPVLRRKLRYVPDSPGIYEADLGAMPEGVYRAELDRASLGGVATGAVAAAEFSVAPSIHSETVELAADRGLLTRLAALTGGRVYEPAAIGELRARLGPAVTTRVERRQVDIWNSWPLFLLFIMTATAEWLLRKRARLP